MRFNVIVMLDVTTFYQNFTRYLHLSLVFAQYFLYRLGRTNPFFCGFNPNQPHPQTNPQTPHATNQHRHTWSIFRDCECCVTLACFVLST